MNGYEVFFIFLLWILCLMFLSCFLLDWVSGFWLLILWLSLSLLSGYTHLAILTSKQVIAMGQWLFFFFFFSFSIFSLKYVRCSGAVWKGDWVFSVFFFILFVSLYELVCIELKFQALVLVHFKLVATLLVGLTAHCGHRLVGFIFELNVSMDFDWRLFLIVKIDSE